jgi:protein tyrosine phosphatase (PTP) superfamily phosphohydrolase (DUF442 family)
VCPAAAQEKAQSPSAAESASARPAVPAQRLQVEGIPNLGKVSESLYRGGQPEKNGYVELKNMGIELVINLRDEKDRISREKIQVEALGMQFVSIPWGGFSPAKNADVARFLTILRENSGRKIFVHCRRGAERTGVMIAAYRISEEKWSPQQALNEMEAFKFRGFFFRHLKRYVKQFPGQLQRDPLLRPFSDWHSTAN